MVGAAVIEGFEHAEHPPAKQKWNEQSGLGLEAELAEPEAEAMRHVCEPLRAAGPHHLAGDRVFECDSNTKKIRRKVSG